MNKVLRFLLLLVVIVVGFYLTMAVFLIFVFLTALGGLFWLYLRYFGKNAKVTRPPSREGVTIDQVPSPSSFPPKQVQGSNSSEVLEALIQETPYDADYVKAQQDDPQTFDALYQIYEEEVVVYCGSPTPELPNTVHRLLEFIAQCDDNQLRAKAYRLLGELHEANDKPVLSLEYYQKALALDEKVGVKRKISKLQKNLSL